MGIAVLTLIAGFAVITAIIAVNGYFVAQEFAYMSVDRSRLRALAADGNPAARRALEVTERTSFMLSGAQLGITVTGLLVGYVAEPLVGESLSVLLGGVGVPAAVSISIGTVGALGISTIVQMIFGELYPKNLAIADPEPLALRLARSTRLYLRLFGWLITVFDHAANALLRLVRVEPVHDLDSSATADDLEHVVADSRESGDLREDLSIMLDRILDFPHRDVGHAMVPRPRVDTVDVGTTIDDARRLMASAHSRYPVLDDDEPVGIVHLVDVLGTVDGTRAVEAIMRVPVMLPELMPLPEALRRMTEARANLACVIDEFGGFAGILTVEDLAEEIVGDLTDEHDESGLDEIEVCGPASWRMAGAVHVDEAERAVGHELPPGDWETMAGLVIACAGSLPATGDVVRVDLPGDRPDVMAERPVHRFLTCEVLEVAKHVPDLLAVTLHEVAASGPGTAAEAGR